MLKDDVRALAKKLSGAGIENADAEARMLIEHVTGYDRARQITHGSEALSAKQLSNLFSLSEKRCAHYPLQYLLGEWSFMGIGLSVGEGVLIPRDDTEVCVGLCLDFLKDKQNPKAIDLCSGSGAIALALEKYGNAETYAVELSEPAFYFLSKNIDDNNSRVKAVKGDVFECHGGFEDGEFDLIVSNPPYIASGELSGLQEEVRFEPSMALDGGADGLAFYRRIVADWHTKLRRGGALVFELGEGQVEPVDVLMKQHGFEKIRTEVDFGGCHRAIIGTML